MSGAPVMIPEWVCTLVGELVLGRDAPEEWRTLVGRLVLDNEALRRQVPPPPPGKETLTMNTGIVGMPGEARQRKHAQHAPGCAVLSEAGYGRETPIACTCGAE